MTVTEPTKQDLSRRLNALKKHVETARNAAAAGDKEQTLENLEVVRLLADDVRRDLGLLVAKQKTSAANTGRPRTAEGDEIRDKLVSLFESKHKPLRFSEIQSALKANGQDFPSPAHLQTYLRSTEDIIRIARGLYALRDWELVYDVDRNDWLIEGNGRTHPTAIERELEEA